MIRPVEQFRDAIRAAGLNPPDTIEADGKLHRFASNGKRGDDAGWCVLHDDGIPAGAFGDWRTGINETWRADMGRRLTPDEQAAHRARVEAIRRDCNAEEARRHAEGANNASAILKLAKPATDDHAYLVRKGIEAHGARVGPWRQRSKADCLLIPMRDTDGVLWNTQAIFPMKDAALDRDKDFLKNGRKRGLFFSIGKPDGVLCIVEGFATGASIHEATGHAVAVAFDKDNLEPVGRALRAKFPELRLILCADDDAATAGNPGVTKATEAARSIGGLLAIPDFGAVRPEGASDFNDVHQSAGLDAVRACIANATAPAILSPQPGDGNVPAGDPASHEWPEPQPLVVQTDSTPYPTDALPGGIGAVVREVVGFVQCPVSLAACSALSALSLVAQGLANVRRADKLAGPASLYLLAIADSGERKTTCDGFFTTAFREWEAQQAEAAKPKQAKHAAATQAWEAKRDGVLTAIKQLAKDSKPTDCRQAELERLESDKPMPLIVPLLLHGDSTPEALGFAMSRGWHSGAVISSEAGIVFGGHGMGRDSIMRNLALLNVLWDGGTLKVDRRTSESYTLSGARLTMGLAVQPDTVRAFFDASKGLARGTGFASRLLIAWPDSTQGDRPFKAAPISWPHLSAFNRRIGAMLDLPLNANEQGELEPPILDLSADANAVWIAFHDEIERELETGGEMADTRDVASKAADNAARLSALFHLYGEGAPGAIGEEHMRAAARIVAWHLYEAQRFLGELALPQALSNAARLDSWLLRYCREHKTASVPHQKARQYGPGSLRDRRALADALDELIEAGRLRLTQEGRQKRIQINPALLKVNDGAT